MLSVLLFLTPYVALKLTEVTKLLADKWKELDDDEKAVRYLIGLLWG